MKDLFIGVIRRIADTAFFVRMTNSEVLDVGQDGACGVLFASSGADMRGDA